MLVYEVNLEVEPEINFAYAGWLPEHIDRMLKFNGFKAAYWFFRNPEDEGREPTDKKLWTIHYLVEDRESLDDYLRNHAKTMRQEAVEKFGTKFRSNRRILGLLSVAGFPLENETAAASAK